MSKTICRIGRDGKWEETDVPDGVMLVYNGASSDPYSDPPGPHINYVDWSRMVYTVEGDGTERPIPPNHVRDTKLTWRPSSRFDHIDRAHEQSLNDAKRAPTPGETIPFPPDYVPREFDPAIDHVIKPSEIDPRETP